MKSRMLPNCSAILFLTFFWSVFSQAEHSDVTANHPSGGKCESMTLAQAQKYLEEKASGEFFSLYGIVGDLRPCEGEIKPGGKLACLERLYRFAVAEVRSRRSAEGSKYSMGFSLATEDYLASRPKEAISVPTEIVAGLPNAIDTIIKIKAPSWQGAQFASRTNGTLRYVLEMSDAKYTRWALFIEDRGKQKIGSADTTLDIIAVEKDTKSPKIHFAEYTLKNGKFELEKITQRCTSCHISGPISISPAYGSTNPTGHTTLDKINANIIRISKGGVNWHGTWTPDWNGPALGEAHGCTDCHDGKRRGAITALTEYSLLRLKLQEDLSMPPLKKESEKSLLKRLDLNGFPFRNAFQVRLVAQANKVLDRQHTDIGGREILGLHKLVLESTPSGREKSEDILDLEVLKSRFTEATSALDKLNSSRNKALKAWVLETPCLPPSAN